MTITYKLHNALYINVTNRCTNRCGFCIRNTTEGVGEGMDLWLEREPTVQEIMEEIFKHDLSQYEEIVFCGYGEPMVRAYDVLEVCKRIKEKYNIPIRVNTNGHANLIHNQDITPLLKGLVDSISISLNAKSAAQYQEVCRSDYGEEAFDALLDFARRCKKYISTVILTVVDVMKDEDIKECQRIAQELGVQFRIRHYAG